MVRLLRDEEVAHARPLPNQTLECQGAAWPRRQILRARPTARRDGQPDEPGGRPTPIPLKDQGKCGRVRQSHEPTRRVRSHTRIDES